MAGGAAAASGFAFGVRVLVSAGLPELRFPGLLLAELGGFGLLWTLAAAVRGPGLETP